MHITSSQDELDYYLLQVELAWHEWKRTNLPRNQIEWLEIFWQDGNKNNLKLALKQRIAALEDQIDYCVFSRRENPDYTDYWNGQIKKYTKEIDNIEWFLKSKSQDKYDKVIHSFEDKKQRAKNWSIVDNFPGTLLRSGKEYKALCPFHAEKTPSFFINPEKNAWYCYGESIGGDNISFYMKLYNVDFRTAVHILSG